jgi:hypothetical protein
MIDIPGKFLVEIVKRKIDALVAEGHRKFVMTDYPEITDSIVRFLGLKGANGISGFACVIWLHKPVPKIPQDRQEAYDHFRILRRAVLVELVEGTDADKVYGLLMKEFYRRYVVAAGQQKKEGVIEMSDDEMLEPDDGKAVGTEEEAKTVREVKPTKNAEMARAISEAEEAREAKEAAATIERLLKLAMQKMDAGTGKMDVDDEEEEVTCAKRSDSVIPGK